MLFFFQTIFCLSIDTQLKSAKDDYANSDLIYLSIVDRHVLSLFLANNSLNLILNFTL